MRWSVFALGAWLLLGPPAQASAEGKNEPVFRNGTLSDLKVAGRAAYLISPNGTPDPKRRWVWIAPSWLGNHLSGGAGAGKDEVSHQFYVESFLAKGLHVAGVDVGTSCGSVPGVEVCQKFYELLTEKYRLNKRARLIGQSNGGLIMYAWAWRHPREVDRIFGIYPVTDMRTWPGLDKVAGKGPNVLPLPELGYQMTVKELAARLKEFNPIDNLKPLADAGVRIFHLHGDQDTLVPIGPNSEELVRRYRALGGKVELEVVKGAGHRPGPDFYQSPRAVAFLLE
jgi:pimeloyl-ACP methyl ester carboxylesterase